MDVLGIHVNDRQTISMCAPTDKYLPTIPQHVCKHTTNCKSRSSDIFGLVSPMQHFKGVKGHKSVRSCLQLALICPRGRGLQGGSVSTTPACYSSSVRCWCLRRSSVRSIHWRKMSSATSALFPSIHHVCHLIFKNICSLRSTASQSNFIHQVHTTVLVKVPGQENELLRQQ